MCDDAGGGSGRGRGRGDPKLVKVREFLPARAAIHTGFR
jgi:hypothetical protein